MFCMLKTIYPAQVSKHNTNCEKQVILLMISNKEKSHYPVVKKLSALLMGTTSKNNGNFYYLNCVHSFRTKNKLELYKRVCGIKDFWNVIMPSKETNW